jgi:hypothetical protein
MEQTPKVNARTKAKATKAGSAAPGKRKVDWDAVERDYRATQMTLRELGAKYDCSHVAIAQKAKKLQWVRDLNPAVRQATTDLLVKAAVNEAVHKSEQAITNTVIAVAEMNSRVILGHRKRLEQLTKDADAARDKLIQLADSIADIKEAATYVSALEASARTVKLVIEGERKAYGLDDDDGKKQDDKLSELISQLGNSTVPVVKSDKA